MRLLVSCDGSDGGRDALELARVLCTATGASALVVDVIYAGPLPMEFALLPEEEAAEAGPAFAAAREALAGIEVETRAYGGGSPAAILTSIAEEEELDGIVVGSPHRSGLDRFLSGSVAIGVLNGAHVDVYVAPPGYADASHDGLETVAVGYLGTPESKVALRRALQLVDRDGRLEILTVVEPPVPLSPAGEDLTKPLDPDRSPPRGSGGPRGTRGRSAKALGGGGAGAGEGLRRGRRPAGPRLARLRAGPSRPARLGLRARPPPRSLPGAGHPAPLSRWHGRSSSSSRRGRRRPSRRFSARRRQSGSRASPGEARERFAGRAIWNISSTLRGGGVAEMLRSLLPYVRGAGVDTRWAVLREDPAFFRLTKRLHNNLHEDRGDGGPLDDAERALYEGTLSRQRPPPAQAGQARRRRLPPRPPDRGAGRATSARPARR